MCDIDFKKLQKLDPKSIKTLTKTWTDKKTGEKKSMSQRYITARTVMNILDSVVGPQNWRAEYRASNLTPAVIVMQCTLYLKIDGEWIGKSDIGTQSDIEPEKGAASDAFKRAAVHWGIGRELYNEGIADLSEDDEPAHAEPEAIHDRARTLEDAPVDDPFTDVTWTRDRTVTAQMVSAAGDYWKISGAHLYNRVAVALDLPAGNYKKRDDLLTAIAEHYTGDKDDARALLKAYKSEESAS